DRFILLGMLGFPSEKIFARISKSKACQKGENHANAPDGKTDTACCSPLWHAKPRMGPETQNSIFLFFPNWTLHLEDVS
ncbi:hypothetical protein NDU88_009772, partial [Pleurodeles waltl]